MDKNITDRQLKYYYYAAFKHFLFSSTIHDNINKYSKVLLSEDFLNTFIILIKTNEYTNIYDEDILIRIQELINHIRDNNIDKNKYFPLINEIIVNLNRILANSYFTPNMNNLFCLEVNNRISNIESINLKRLNKNVITDSIINDFVILNEHLFNYEDYDTFLHDSIKWVMNPMYYYSLNAILSECNDLFNNKLFVENARIILDENDKIIGQYRSFVFDKVIHDFDKRDVVKIKKIDKCIINKLYIK